MSGPARTAIDLGAEVAVAPWEYALVAVAAAAALAWLARGVLVKRRRLASGEACGDCPGCGSAGVCQSKLPFAVPKKDTEA
ncbi:MAG: hypothetical protein ACLFTP_08680 [Rhodosalinus sp.]|uniref:hypothetical protein n=1 Tax=Rhodosalinus sp. TaxID=2047741 RepID=UPI00397DB1C3